MKNKFFKNVSVFALAVVIALSSFSMVAKAGASTCDRCYGSNISATGWERRISVDYVNPNAHLVYAEVEYYCSDCKLHIYFEEYYEEGHSYNLVESTGLMRCGSCGDSYYAY